MAKLTRKELLIKLEKIVGSSCYNGNIQNWDANGEWLGEGRAFRYPIRINGLSTRTSIKADVTDHDLQAAYYAFGANQLHIIRALDEVLDFIECEYGVDIPKTKIKPKKDKADPKQKTECAYCGKMVVDIIQHVSQSHPDYWQKYTSSNDVSHRLSGKSRCNSCGSFLKSLENHAEKCPKTLERN
ncbi:hypothetical protein [Vibrio jasicida]|uniref:hypothetical protein n=1 Tax=Vibrio jasicida TaxID=766224 RepID=UPI000CE47E92|nr:hypothetical protein [Vibrio jasicida]